MESRGLSQAEIAINNMAEQVAVLSKENAILKANLEILSVQLEKKEKENETSD